jgi:hypothetical protein
MALPEYPPITTHQVSTTIASVANGVAGVIHAPFRAQVVKVGSVLAAPVTTADATVTTSIGATAITGGAFVITQSGSAIGDLDSSVPTAANVCNEGDVIKFAMTGSGTAGANSAVFAVLKRI